MQISDNKLFSGINKYSMACFGYSIFVRSRKQIYTYHRFSVIYILHVYYKYSLDRIAKICGGAGEKYNHASIHHAKEVVDFQVNNYKARRDNVAYWHKIIDQIISSAELPNSEIMIYLNEKISQTTGREREILIAIKENFGEDAHQSKHTGR